MSGLYLLSGLFITIAMVVGAVLKFGPAPKAVPRKEEEEDEGPHPEQAACDEVVTAPVLRLVKDEDDYEPPQAA